MAAHPIGSSGWRQFGWRATISITRTTTNKTFETLKRSYSERSAILSSVMRMLPARTRDAAAVHHARRTVARQRAAFDSSQSITERARAARHSPSSCCAARGAADTNDCGAA